MTGNVENPFARYEALDAREAAREAARLSADDARSLAFFRIDRALAVGEPVAGSQRSQVMIWVATMRDVEDFAGEFGRLPRENNRLPFPAISVRERALADWIRYQRRSASRDRHCSYQILRLETLPGFSWSPQDDLWRRSFDDYQRFVANSRRSPSSRSVDLQERRLAVWASKQRYGYRRGELLAERIRLLEALPIWSWGSR